MRTWRLDSVLVSSWFLPSVHFFNMVHVSLGSLRTRHISQESISLMNHTSMPTYTSAPCRSMVGFTTLTPCILRLRFVLCHELPLNSHLAPWTAQFLKYEKVQWSLLEPTTPSNRLPFALCDCFTRCVQRLAFSSYQGCSLSCSAFDSLSVFSACYQLYSVLACHQLCSILVR